MTAQNTADAIAYAFFELMEEERFDKIPVSAIARAAHCNRSTFYRHFETKDDVVCWRVRMAMGGTLEEIVSPRARTFDGYLLEMFESMRQNRRVFELIRRDRLNDHLLDSVNHLFDVEYDRSRLSVEEQYALAFHIGGIVNHIRLWTERDMVDTPEELVRHVRAGFAEGFVPLRVRLSARAKFESRD